MLEIPPHVSFYYQIALFFVLAFLLRSLIWQPTQRVLAERERRTHGATAEAAHMRDEAVALEAQLASALEAARESGSDAGDRVRREAEAREREVLEAAHSDAVSLLGETRERLERETAEARSTLEGQSATLARLAAERILGREVSA